MAAELAYVNRRGEMFLLVSLALVLLAAACLTRFIHADVASEKFRCVARNVVATSDG
jgi:hypothetical protein